MSGKGPYLSWAQTARVPGLRETQNQLGVQSDGNAAELVPAQDFFRRVTIRNVDSGVWVALAFEIAAVRANAIQSDTIILPSDQSDVIILSPGQGLYARSLEVDPGRVTYAVSEALPIKQE